MSNSTSLNMSISNNLSVAGNTVLNNINSNNGVFSSLSSTNLTITGTININSSDISSINSLTANNLTVNSLNINSDINSNGNMTFYNKSLFIKKADNSNGIILTNTGDLTVSGTTTLNNTIIANVLTANSGFTVLTNSTIPTPTLGTITLKKSTAYDISSIVFTSAANNNSDYASIEYYDDVYNTNKNYYGESAVNESSCLFIGCQNDEVTTTNSVNLQDNIIIRPNANLILDAGTYSNTTNTITQTNTNNSIIIAPNSSNVGIGTLTPKSKLHIKGNTTIEGNINCSMTGTNNLYLFSNNHYITTIGNNAILYYSPSHHVFYGNNNILFRIMNDYTATYNTAIFNGNVGIGTYTPTEKLHIIGNIKAEGNLNINGLTTLTGNTTIEGNLYGSFFGSTSLYLYSNNHYIKSINNNSIQYYSPDNHVFISNNIDIFRVSSTYTTTYNTAIFNGNVNIAGNIIIDGITTINNTVNINGIIGANSVYSVNDISFGGNLNLNSNSTVLSQNELKCLDGIKSNIQTQIENISSTNTLVSVDLATRSIVLTLPLPNIVVIDCNFRWSADPVLYKYVYLPAILKTVNDGVKLTIRRIGLLVGDEVVIQPHFPSKIYPHNDVLFYNSITLTGVITTYELFAFNGHWYQI